ncbi:3-hydroxyacyl-CoA dehydrogenase family protein [Clostridium botulinum]|uniref:3-hydroxybutyryl-CoA dehydrogenase n=1 Tax=Clostridium botulinum TaxID=1491 RepID=A0A6B4JL29_CLOBO|nr:3-hydroxyacyl-CoA dehydrogenase family protein [Clostridium botulinum]EES49323.1 3-hydroxybutyryl-coa dehydrogenase [Clostridium botulinum E1 str. 'BoNT E Beluga']MBY6760965.1 3-hydroxyacyl-CoA dehydrogenase family protein [Clostridium botulinum]MBY6919743.1 3-hydroxyacyl-CoA dehydrogenase family protein [Clostridium botulinum]MCR1130757.1 3-hydroxyacyl-CoA dehydrogenase family protein [Clostridium botulinum]NFH69377.1 3-hydroxyacyl-CoA dehydrogenase family protein [Clostridium botulinum]
MNIKNIAVLGTGTMGHGIALLSARAGLNVKMYGRTDESLDRGISSIIASLNRLTIQGKLNESECQEIISRIKGVKTLEEVAKDTDFIIESVAENLELKQSIFKKLDLLCKPEVILASNTSGLSPTDIARNTTNPERVVIAHFWNPPQLIPLVEVVPGEKTNKDTVEKTVEWVNFIGKKAVKMEKECLGFIGNRLQLALLREAMYIVEKGWAKPEEVDKAMEYGHGRRLPVTGPLCSADLGGLDIFNNISSYLFKDLCSYTEPSKLMEEKVKENKLGTKNGEGFYKWTKEEVEEKQRERTEVLLYFLDRD